MDEVAGVVESTYQIPEIDEEEARKSQEIENLFHRNMENIIDIAFRQSSELSEIVNKDRNGVNDVEKENDYATPLHPKPPSTSPQTAPTAAHTSPVEATYLREWKNTLTKVYTQYYTTDPPPYADGSPGYSPPANPPVFSFVQSHSTIPHEFEISTRPHTSYNNPPGGVDPQATPYETYVSCILHIKPFEATFATYKKYYEHDADSPHASYGITDWKQLFVMAFYEDKHSFLAISMKCLADAAKMVTDISMHKEFRRFIRWAPSPNKESLLNIRKLRSDLLGRQYADMSIFYYEQRTNVRYLALQYISTNADIEQLIPALEFAAEVFKTPKGENKANSLTKFRHNWLARAQKLDDTTTEYDELDLITVHEARAFRTEERFADGMKETQHLSKMIDFIQLSTETEYTLVNKRAEITNLVTLAYETDILHSISKSVKYFIKYLPRYQAPE